MTIQGRIKRLRKLLYFSRKTIRDFGFGYFLSLTLTEIKRYGLDVFKEDPSSNYYAPRTDEINYNNWITNEDNKHKKTRNDVKSLAKQPRLTAIISVDDDNEKLLKETLSSIDKQNYQNIVICICGEISYNNTKNQSSDNSKIIKTKTLQEAITQSKGDFTIFCNSGDILNENALLNIIFTINDNPDAELIYSDEDQINQNGMRDSPFFKPDWSPDLFLGLDYISNFYIVSYSIIKDCKVEDIFDKAKNYDLLLQITEKTKKIIHIPTVLASVNSINYNESKKSLQKNGIAIIEKTLKRRNISGKVVSGLMPSTFRIKYNIQGNPKVSIVIPTRDNVILLKRCIKSLKNKTVYKNFEVIIVDNNSEKEETKSYLASLPYKIVRYKEPFNFAKINNIAVSQTNGDYLLFMNDDVAALESDWLSEMISLYQLKGVGVVGPKLVYDNSTVQHAGIAILKTGSGFHPMNGLDSRSAGYFGFLNTIRNCSAVTGACLLISRKIFDEVGRFDEKFDLYYNDVDLCLKVVNQGYRVIYTPYAKLLHQGSSKIKEYSTAFYAVENHYRLIKKWPYLKKGDPFYNPNLGWDYKFELD
ncbi:MAG: glycosyltransferase family 2 protein [Nitrosotalea sp.]